MAGCASLLVTFSAGISFGQGEPESDAAESDAAESDAAESDAATTSKEQFIEARRLYDEGQYERAVPLLAAVFEATGSPNAQLYVARALRELGRLDEAHRAMALARKVATAEAVEDPRYEPTRDAAASELAILDAKVAKVVVAFVEQPAGTQVTLNGSPLVETQLGSPMAVLPGTVTIVATAPGKPEIRREQSLSAGMTVTIALAFVDASPAPQSPDAPTETRGGGVRTAGFVALGIGVIGMGMFGVTYAMAGGVESDLEEACSGKRCTEDKFADDVDRGKTLDTLANVGLIVGAVGLVSGAAMVLFGGPTEVAQSGPTVGVGPNGATASWQTAF